VIERLSQQEIERFWSKVQRGDGCWLWTGEINNQGYGRFCTWRGGRKRFFAHRLAYELTRGPLEGLMARHRCDNPPCCNPDHLDPGTQQDNMRDARKRGRTNTVGLDEYRVRATRQAAAKIALGLRWCNGCKRVRSLDDFPANKNSPGGRHYTCRACVAIRQERRKAIKAALRQALGESA